MFARYYNSATGRFLSPDWDAKSSDPVPYAKLSDPQSLNLYDYVLNNPVTTEDPNGHWPAVLVDTARVLAEAAEAGGRAVIDLDPAVAIAIVGYDIKQLVDPPKVGQSDADEIAERDKLDHEKQSAEPQASSDGARKGGGKKYDDTAENRARMAQGRPPIGNDGHPLERHHTDQTMEGDSETMTRTEHRLDGNYAKNHTNTGQSPSKIDRTKAKQANREHWKKESSTE